MKVQGSQEYTNYMESNVNNPQNTKSKSWNQKSNKSNPIKVTELRTNNEEKVRLTEARINVINKKKWILTKKAKERKKSNYTWSQWAYCYAYYNKCNFITCVGNQTKPNLMGNICMHKKL